MNPNDLKCVYPAQDRAQCNSTGSGIEATATRSEEHFLISSAINMPHRDSIHLKLQVIFYASAELGSVTLKWNSH